MGQVVFLRGCYSCGIQEFSFGSLVIPPGIRVQLFLVMPSPADLEQRATLRTNQQSPHTVGFLSKEDTTTLRRAYEHSNIATRFELVKPNSPHRRVELHFSLAGTISSNNDEDDLLCQAAAAQDHLMTVLNDAQYDYVYDEYGVAFDAEKETGDSAINLRAIEMVTKLFQGHSRKCKVNCGYHCGGVQSLKPRCIDNGWTIKQLAAQFIGEHELKPAKELTGSRSQINDIKIRRGGDLMGRVFPACYQCAETKTMVYKDTRSFEDVRKDNPEEWANDISAIEDLVDESGEIDISKENELYRNTFTTYEAYWDAWFPSLLPSNLDDSFAVKYRARVLALVANEVDNKVEFSTLVDFGDKRRKDKDDSLWKSMGWSSELKSRCTKRKASPSGGSVASTGRPRTVATGDHAGGAGLQLPGAPQNIVGSPGIPARGPTENICFQLLPRCTIS